MDSRTILLVAVFSLGFIGAPQAVAMFQGGHVWYDKDNIPCQKCHADVFAQLDGSAHHTDIGTAFGMTSYEGECRACHQVGGWEENSHMAVTPLCISCHPHVHDELALASEAHKQFYKDTILAGKANFACLGCHTHVDVNVKYFRPVKYSFSASARPGNYSDCDDAAGGMICGVISNWTFGDFNADVGKYEAEGETQMIVSGYSTQLYSGDFDPDDWFDALTMAGYSNNAETPKGNYLPPDFETVAEGELSRYGNDNPQIPSGNDTSVSPGVGNPVD